MRVFYLTIFSLLLSTSLFAQEVYSSSGRPIEQKRVQQNEEDEKGFSTKKIIFGGWGVFGIGSGVTNIGATPILGYRITKNFSAGIGLGYQYLRVKDYFALTDPNTLLPVYETLNAHLFSPSVWARYLVWRNIFVQTEYEQNITMFKEYYTDYTQNIPVITNQRTVQNVPCLLVGAGLRQPISDRSSFVIMALYDVLQNDYSPYRNTIALRIGFNVGF